MPELTELSKNIMIEETRQGLNIEIADQDGRSMFPEGGNEPYDRTRRLLQKMATPLKALPNRISIAGHTSASRTAPKSGYGPWELSADRANVVRQILETEGIAPNSVLHGCGARGFTTALYRRSLHRRQPPCDYHVDAGRAAFPGGIQAVTPSAASCAAFTGAVSIVPEPGRDHAYSLPAGSDIRSALPR